MLWEQGVGKTSTRSRSGERAGGGGGGGGGGHGCLRLDTRFIIRQYGIRP